MLVNLIKHHQASPNYNRLFVTLPAWPPTESLVAYVSVTALRSRPTSDESDVTRVQLWSIAAVSLMELIIIILVHFQNVSHNRHNPDIAWALYFSNTPVRQSDEEPWGEIMRHRKDKTIGPTNNEENCEKIDTIGSEEPMRSWDIYKLKKKHVFFPDGDNINKRKDTKITNRVFRQLSVFSLMLQHAWDTTGDWAFEKMWANLGQTKSSRHHFYGVRLCLSLHVANCHFPQPWRRSDTLYAASKAGPPVLNNRINTINWHPKNFRTGKWRNPGNPKK